MERRKDNKGRILQKGESQRSDLTYMFRYNDLDGKRKCIYARTLDELRKKEKEISKNLHLISLVLIHSFYITFLIIKFSFASFFAIFDRTSLMP